MSENALDDYKKLINNVFLYAIWFTRGTLELIIDFNTEVIKVLNALRRAQSQQEKREIAIEQFAVLVIKAKKVGDAINEDVIVMHDVESFLLSRKRINIIDEGKLPVE